MEELNERILNVGRNIFKQLEVNKDQNVIIRPEDVQLLFEYIFALEKAYDELKAKQEPKQEENVES